MPTIQSVRRTQSGRPGKRAINLSLSADVLDAARQLDFITAYNATIEAENLPLDEWRSF